MRFDRTQKGIVAKAALADVRHVHRRLHRQQKEWPQHVAFRRVEIGRSRRPALIEHRFHLVHHRDDLLRFLVVAGTRGFLVLGELFLDSRKVGERELGVDRRDV
jgi:hypothetical protein